MLLCLLLGANACGQQLKERKKMAATSWAAWASTSWAASLLGSNLLVCAVCVRCGQKERERDGQDREKKKKKRRKEEEEKEKKENGRQGRPPKTSRPLFYSPGLAACMARRGSCQVDKLLVGQLGRWGQVLQLLKIS